MGFLSKKLLQAIGFASLASGIAFLAYNTSANELIRRMAILLGGEMPGGVIQFVIYLAFFWCVLEIMSLLRKIEIEKDAFGYLGKIKTLPSIDNEHLVLSPEKIRDIKLEVIDFHKQMGKEFLLTNLIKKASTKFRADKSISDVLNVVSEQARINFSRSESSQGLIRFLTWSLPSLGFIGTIMGIAGALGLANQAGTEEGLEKITNALYMAFDTTLLALFLSIIVMWLFHRLQEKEEKLHIGIEEYVIENLVNRIVLR